MSAQESPALRIYASLRTAHLERFREMAPAQVLYHRTRYDYDERVADPGAVPRRVGRWGAIAELARHSYRVVEVNEPIMTDRWPDLIGQIAAARVRGLVTGKEVRLVAYCIGLTDPAEALRLRWRLPRWLCRVIARVMLTALLAGMHQLAFGTSGAMDLYATYVPRRRLEAKSRVFEALPRRCDCSADSSDRRRTGTLLFLGAFDDRKGIALTMRAWDALRIRHPHLRMHVIGKGPLADSVTEWASTHPEVELDIDPPRAAIHRALRESSAVVLLSQRVGPWREQVGLPIVEALAHGCSVITTSETGLASWLAAHGHAVIDSSAGADVIAGVVAETLHRGRPKAQILDDLPATDRRIDADDWLMSLSGSK